MKTPKKSRIIQGDSLETLQQFPDDFFSSLVTDPPAGISFMNKSWDANKGGRDEWIKWLSEIMKEAYRVLKPGAHGLVWALPRTSGWTQRALEDAGFEVRDVITHLFGSGFPKSHNVGLAVDKINGVESKTVGKNKHGKMFVNAPENLQCGYAKKGGEHEIKEAQNEWKGWGTGLKPAAEFWILVRKPFKGTVASNVLKYGTGALNIDGCRVGCSDKAKFPVGDYGESNFRPNQRNEDPAPQGRFPANVILECSCPDEVFYELNENTPEDIIKEIKEWLKK